MKVFGLLSSACVTFLVAICSSCTDRTPADDRAEKLLAKAPPFDPAHFLSGTRRHIAVTLAPQRGDASKLTVVDAAVAVGGLPSVVVPQGAGREVVYRNSIGAELGRHIIADPYEVRCCFIEAGDIATSVPRVKPESFRVLLPYEPAIASITLGGMGRDGVSVDLSSVMREVTSGK